VVVRVGRKFGDVANESVRFDVAVAKSALKFGDVEPGVGAAPTFAKLLGHTALAPSSTPS
jgi:hypothetical protein